MGKTCRFESVKVIHSALCHRPLVPSGPLSSTKCMHWSLGVGLQGTSIFVGEFLAQGQRLASGQTSAQTPRLRAVVGAGDPLPAVRCCLLSPSVQATVENAVAWCLTNDICPSQFWRLDVPRSRCWQIWRLEDGLPGSWMAPSLCLHREEGRGASLRSLYKDTSHGHKAAPP